MTESILKNSTIHKRLMDTAKKYNLDGNIKSDMFEGIKDSMSVEDYNIGQTLMNYYLKQQASQNEYDASLKDFIQKKDNILQNNGIAKELNKLYLLKYLKQQGVSGHGFEKAQTRDIYNALDTNTRELNKNFENTKNQLLNAYANDLKQIDNVATKNVDNYIQALREAENKETYEAFKDYLESWSFSSFDELKEAYGKVKDKFTENQKIAIERQIDALAKYPDEFYKEVLLKKQAAAIEKAGK